VQAQGVQLAVEDFSLAFQALKLALAWVVLRRNGRLQIVDSRLWPRSRQRFVACQGLFFEPGEAAVQQLQAGLDGAGLLPDPLAVEGGKRVTPWAKRRR